MNIWLSDELKEAGALVIEECHQPLAGLKIAWFFKDKATKKPGSKFVLGKAIAVSDRDWLLHKYDVIIEIAHDMWKISSDEARKALLDHKLSHVIWEGDLDEESERPLVWLLGHDIEEFEKVLARRGCWHPGLRGFLNAGEPHRKDPEAPTA